MDHKWKREDGIDLPKSLLKRWAHELDDASGAGSMTGHVLSSQLSNYAEGVARPGWDFTCSLCGSQDVLGKSPCPAGEPGEPLLQFFGYAHLPDALQAVSRPFWELAQQIVNTLPRNPERTTALRKLLEAKDCAVRSTIYKAA